MTGIGQAVQSLENYLIMPYIKQRVVSLPPALLLITQLTVGAGNKMHSQSFTILGAVENVHTH